MTWAVDALFTRESLIVHTIWFIVWFSLKLDVGLLTNLVSLEAIYGFIFQGMLSKTLHDDTRDHVTKETQ